MRRAATIPLYALTLALLIATAPLWIAAAASVDLVRRSRWALVRTLLVFTVYFGFEIAGLTAALALWLGGRASDPVAHSRLQRWWVSGIFEASRRIFGAELVVEGAESWRPGPVLLVLRHASVADTLLPGRLVDLQLRYVLKRELLLDPCLDVVGHRLPNAFVQRGSADTASDLTAIVRLVAALGPTDGVVLFPEGTRFSSERRARAIAKLEAAQSDELDRARALKRVLPPRTAGLFAILDHAPGLDVVFCAHVGLDSTRTLGDLSRGALVGRRLQVKMWRVSAAQIPREPPQRTAWLYDQWTAIDRWILARSDPGQDDADPASVLSPGP